jgi:hypothetical protein
MWTMSFASRPVNTAPFHSEALRALLWRRVLREGLNSISMEWVRLAIVDRRWLKILVIRRRRLCVAEMVAIVSLVDGKVIECDAEV